MVIAIYGIKLAFGQPSSRYLITPLQILVEMCSPFNLRFVTVNENYIFLKYCSFSLILQ